jgi:hypothetical protein
LHFFASTFTPRLSGAEALYQEIKRLALTPKDSLVRAIRAYGPSVTPYLDGRSSIRVLDAVEEMLQGGWQDSKPSNSWRNFMMRQQLINTTVGGSAFLRSIVCYGLDFTITL